MDFKAHSDVIRAFLNQARKSGVTDLATHTELVRYLDLRTGRPVEVEATESTQPVPQPAAREHRAAPTPSPPARRIEPPRPRPKPKPEPMPVAPPPPPKPGELARRWSAIREAVVSDLSLHGFSYLGVLVIFASVLGLLLFAFADIPDAHQPFYELVIALVFFGFAWYLRRQHATYVARAMELIGGMALPLVLFAGLVDNAPVPPDFRGTGLVVALTLTSLGLSVVYAVWSARHEDSVLGHLVAPLWWLAALTLGFVFKADEPLVGDAITRLVSHQPALAAAAIGLSVVWVTVQRGARLAERSRLSAHVGAPVAYLLTVSLAAGEGWVNTWPLLVAGAATFLSTELLVRGQGKTHRLATLRPFLIAALIVPLLPGLDTAVAGLLIVAVYTTLFEWTARITPSETTALTLSRAGIGLGLAMTLGDPWAALVVFTLISVWAHYRRIRPVGDEPSLVYAAAAAAAPLGVGYALTQIIPGTASWTVMAFILLAAGVATRLTARDDEFWVVWPAGAAILVFAGVIDSTASPDPWRIAALVGVAGTLAVGPRWPLGRLWASATVITIVVGEAAGYFPDPVMGRALALAGVGLAVVAVAALRSRIYSGHLSAIGHLLAGLALSVAHTGLTMAVVVGAWTVGWFVSTVASQRDGESLTALLLRVVGESGRRLAEMTAPLVTVASLPLAIVLALRLWPAYTADGSWAGATFAAVAVGYALVARSVAAKPAILETTAGGAIVLMVVAPVLAAPERIPLVVALAGGVVVSVLLSRTVPSRLLTGYGWAAGYGLVVLVAELAGVATENLDAVAVVVGLTGVVTPLLTDDLLAGRRQPGRGLRVSGLAQPLALGAVTTVVGLLSLLLDLPGSAWWFVAAGVVTVGVAYQLRTGLLSGLGYLLVASGVVALDIGYWIDEPWRLVFLAAPLVGAAVAAHLNQPKTMASNDVLRWDLPALLVSHLIGGAALLFAFTADEVMLTAVVFAVLSLGLGIAYRNRVWLEAGNGLLVLAAIDAGREWLALILGVTAVRSAISAYYTEGVTRRVNHLIGAVSGAIGWVVFLSSLELTLSEAVDLSAVVSGFVLVVAWAGRQSQIQADSVRIWGSAGLAVVAWATWASVAATGVDGPAVAIGLVVSAAAIEVSHHQTHRVIRHIAALTTGLSWLFLVVGLGWSAATAIGVSAIVFGIVAVVIGEMARRAPSEALTGLWTAWGGLAFVAVVTTTIGAWLLGSGTPGYLAAGGVALLGWGTARAATPLEIAGLRATATVLWLTSLVTLAAAANWPIENVAVTTAVAGALSTFAYLGLWVRGRAENWNRPLNTLAIIGNLVAGVLTLYAWPARGLTVAIALSLAAQSIAFGVYRDRPAVLAFAPPLTASAFFVALGEGFARHPLWYTVLLGIVTLSELEILRHVRRHAGQQVDTAATLTVEVLGLGLLVMPALVSMFGDGLAYAGVALTVAVVCLVWAGVTRVRRRVVASGAIALATTVLSIVAAAAGSAPETVAFWVIGAGIGVAVMLVAGFIEAYRSKKGQLMVRLDQLMEGWE